MAIILITGSNGQLGNELQVVSKKFYGYDFIFTDIETLDLTSPEQTTSLIKDSKPNWIINCAAYNLVDKAENESDKAMEINGSAVNNITKAIRGSECRFIHISSDYIFDGESNVPYNESSPANPLSAYGRSKLSGEKNALLYPGSMVIRTSWLYSSFGNNFLKSIIRHANEQESLRVVFDQTGSPTYAADLASAIMSIVSGVIRNQFTFNAGIYNYSNEGVCTWYDFAKEIIQEASLTCDVNPVLTKDYQLTAPRPAYSVLDKSKIKENYNLSIPHWRSSLVKCMNLLK